MATEWRMDVVVEFSHVRTANTKQTIARSAARGGCVKCEPTFCIGNFAQCCMTVYFWERRGRAPSSPLLVQIYRANFFSDVSIEHAHYIVPAPIRRDPHNSKANKLHDTCSPVAIRAVFWESLTVKPRILTASCLIDLALLRNAHVVAAAAASDAINSLVNMRKYFANEWF
ncbi:hypothetical protein U1Q18_050965 [Sarracenia purpurea var. burkii]